MSYEFSLVEGIPVYTKDKGIYTWTTGDPIRFGTLTEAGTIECDADWRETLAPSLAAWRTALAPRNRAELRNGRKAIGGKTKH